MIKRTLITIALVCFMVLPVFAAGPTVTVLTEQLTGINSPAINLRLGFFLGFDSGLEPFIGTEFRPEWDEEDKIKPPSVVKAGVLNWFKDVVDSNSVIPLIPDLFLIFLNEDIQIRPYVGVEWTMDFVNRGGGFMAGIAGFELKTNANSKASILLEGKMYETFDEYAVIDDNRLVWSTAFMYRF